MYGSCVRSQRHNEVVETVAGVVCGHNDRPVRPVVILRVAVRAVLTSLQQKTTHEKQSIRIGYNLSKLNNFLKISISFALLHSCTFSLFTWQ